MKTLQLSDEIIVNDNNIYNADCIVELEGTETISQVKGQFEQQGLNPVYVRFVDYASNLSEEQRERCSFYSGHYCGMAYEVIPTESAMECYTDFTSFQEAVSNMGNTIPEEFGFDDKSEADQNCIIQTLDSWFLFSGHRAEYKDGSWSFVEGETCLNRFPVQW